MLTGNCLKVVNNLRKRRPEYENIEKVDKNIHLLIILFARKSFFLKLFPPEAALPRSPKKSGWTFTRHIFPARFVWPRNFPARIFLAGIFPGQMFSGREISRPDFFWPRNFPARIFLAGLAWCLPFGQGVGAGKLLQ